MRIVHMLRIQMQPSTTLWQTMQAWGNLVPTMVKPVHVVCKVSSRGTFCRVFKYLRSGVLEVYPSDDTALEVVNLGKDPSID